LGAFSPRGVPKEEGLRERLKGRRFPPLFLGGPIYSAPFVGKEVFHPRFKKPPKRGSLSPRYFAL